MLLFQAQPLPCQSHQIWLLRKSIGMGSSPWKGCFLSLGLSISSLLGGGWIDLQVSSTSTSMWFKKTQGTLETSSVMFESPALAPFPRAPAAGGCVPKPGQVATMGFFTGKPGHTHGEGGGPFRSSPERPHSHSNGAPGAHKKLWKLLLQEVF